MKESYKEQLATDFGHKPCAGSGDAPGIYGYDPTDQVTTANYGAGQSDAYAYDPMGNRTTATCSRSVGVPPASGTVTYTANNANQYTAIQQGGTGVSPVHDSNGNLLSGNGVTYTWDSENRLLTYADATTRIDAIYDALHRRLAKKITDLATNTVTSNTQYVYDGWNVIEEIDLTSRTLAKTLIWGGDLSGSLQGAGGVGGLLLIIDHSAGISSHFHYDGNGNVTQLTDDSALPTAAYRYDAFGNTLLATGPAAALNNYRFSTKPIDGVVADAPLYYYGYRFYDPLTGRWPSRDPIEEEGGIDIYSFVRNRPTIFIELLGLDYYDTFENLVQAGTALYLGGKIPGTGPKGIPGKVVGAAGINGILSEVRGAIHDTVVILHDATNPPPPLVVNIHPAPLPKPRLVPKLPDLKPIPPPPFQLPPLPDPFPEDEPDCGKAGIKD